MIDQPFFQWLFSEAGAGWIFGIISLVVLAVSYLMKRKPRRIIFKELSKGSLIRISPEIREKINITYNDERVDAIGHVEAEVYNEGADVIREPTLTLIVPEVVFLPFYAAILALIYWEIAPVLRRRGRLKRTAHD